MRNSLVARYDVLRTSLGGLCQRFSANATANASRGRHESVSMPHFRPASWRANLAEFAVRYLAGCFHSLQKLGVQVARAQQGLAARTWQQVQDRLGFVQVVGAV